MSKPSDKSLGQLKGDFMTWKSFCTTTFFFAFFAFTAVHFANMKSPAQDRYVAGESQVSKPWYDASFKI